MTVNVLTLQGDSNLHLDGTSWDFDEENNLHVKSETGAQVSSYRDGQWAEVHASRETTTK